MKISLAGTVILIGLLMDIVALAGVIDPHVTALKTPLGLSEKQTQELNDIFTEAHDKTQALRNEIKEINKKKQTRIDAVLTTEQKKKRQDMQDPSFPSEANPPQMMPMGIEP
jgi:hypothetical protein